MAGERAVLLDTNVYSALYVTPEETARKQGHPLDAWRAAVRGRRVVIAFQTRAEIVIGTRIARWGASRVLALVQRLDATPTIHLDEDVLDA